VTSEPRNATVELERRLGRRATEVIERLRQVKQARGKIEPGDVDRVAAELRLPRAHVYGAASFYADFTSEMPTGRKVRLCDGASCLAATGGRHAAGIRERLAGVADVEAVYCLGYCYASPSALDGERAHAGLDLPEQLAGEAPQSDPPIPFEAACREPIVLARLLERGPAAWDIWHRVAADPEAPDRILGEVQRSGLQGRGGAGFPVARKWALVRANPPGPRRVVANGDEGDPGSYLDRLLMERDPHGVLEGVALASLACGADRAHVYVRSEYPAARDALRAAVEEARADGHLGENVHGSGVDLEIEVFESAGSYVVGEETALLHSIEGLRGSAAPRPPFPAGRGGLFAFPTAVNNVESLSAVAWIVQHGGEAYARHGTATDRGTKLVCLNERFRNPGVYEVELGRPVTEIVHGLGGGLHSGALRMIQVGGPLGGFLGADELGMPLTLEDLAAHGVALGHGGLVAFDEHTDPGALMRDLWRFAASESCGACVPCRQGTQRGLELAERLAASDARLQDAAELGRLLNALDRGSLCGFGSGVPASVRSLVRVCRQELEPWRA
jgi:NADH:ubiquinone oxidoreductase subunit F (NADH-binding)/NADH:ubiquinone oxidoreductase subunit E